MKKIVILILLSALTTFSRPLPEISNVDQEILECTFNHQIENAYELVYEQILLNRNSPKYYFFMLGIKTMESVIIVDNTGADEKWRVKDSLNQVNLEYTEEVVERFDEDELNIENRFYLAGLYGYLGRMYGLSKSWMSAFSSAKTGSSILEDIIEDNPKYYDAYLLLGMLEYYGDRLSGFTGFIAGLLGMSRDRENGLQNIKIAEEHGVTTKFQAMLLLAELYSRLEANEFDAIPYFEKFVSRFPNNEHTLNWYCRELLELDQTKRVGELIRRDSLNLINDNIKGRYHHMVGDYKKAIKHFENVIVENSNYWRWYSNYARFLYVLDHIILDEQIKINGELNKLNSWQKIVVNKISGNIEVAKELFKFQTAVSVSDDSLKIMNFISAPIDVGEDSLLTAFYSFYKGVFYFRSSQFSEAEVEFNTSKKMYPDLFAARSIKYLIKIYKTIKTDPEKVEYLIDEIDELEFEDLEYSARDLEIIYDL